MGKNPYDSEIEYLQSNGPQFIETHIIPNDTTGVYVKGDEVYENYYPQIIDDKICAKLEKYE